MVFSLTSRSAQRDRRPRHCSPARSHRSASVKICTLTPFFHVEDPVAGVHLYRIACEAVNNAVKHSRAIKVTIALSQGEGSLRLTVADDGCGMDTAAPCTSGMGLPSIRSRARALGGDLNFESSPGNGTVISCEIPNRPNPADLTA